MVDRLNREVIVVSAGRCRLPSGSSSPRWALIPPSQLAKARRGLCRGRSTAASREIEVLGAVAQGMSNKAIAAHLCVSEASVKTHLLRIFAKLDVDDRTAAVTVAATRGMIRLGGWGRSFVLAGLCVAMS